MVIPGSCPRPELRHETRILFLIRRHVYSLGECCFSLIANTRGSTTTLAATGGFSTLVKEVLHEIINEFLAKYCLIPASRKFFWKEHGYERIFSRKATEGGEGEWLRWMASHVPK